MKIKKINKITAVMGLAVTLGVTGIFMTSAMADEQANVEKDTMQNEDLQNDAVQNKDSEKDDVENDNGSDPVSDPVTEPKEVWTADEFAAYFREVQESLPARVNELEELENAGDFIWTQELIEQVLGRCGEMEKEIQNGAEIEKNPDEQVIVRIAEEILAKQAPDLSWAEIYSLEEDTEILVICRSYGICLDSKKGKIIYQGKELDELEIGYNQDKEMERMKEEDLDPAAAPESDRLKCTGGCGNYIGFHGDQDLKLRHWVEICYPDKYKESIENRDGNMLAWGKLAGFYISLEELEQMADCS